MSNTYDRLHDPETDGYTADQLAAAAEESQAIAIALRELANQYRAANSRGMEATITVLQDASARIQTRANRYRGTR